MPVRSGGMEINMKKTFATLFAIFMIISFTACRQVAEDTKDITKDAAEDLTGINNNDKTNGNKKISANLCGTATYDLGHFWGCDHGHP